MALDNSALIAPFMPEKDDGDTFIWTQLLDRGKKKGNNGRRLVKDFFHHSQEHFWEQWPQIKQLCDFAKVRACTRLAPRSYKKVAGEFLRLVSETYITANYRGMKTLYNRAAGIASPVEKLWLFDVDEPSPASEELKYALAELGVLRAVIPSRRAYHLISKPFNLLEAGYQNSPDGFMFEGVQLHKDNPTNLYIPEGAD